MKKERDFYQYATSNDKIYEQYIQSQNVVTRWSLKSILKSRSESGDEDAGIFWALIQMEE